MDLIDTYGTATSARVEPVGDPGETVRVRAGSGSASLVSERALGLDVLLPEVSSMFGGHVGLARFIRSRHSR